MTHIELVDALQEFNRRLGASSEQVAACERWLGASLPSDYIDFLKYTNGGEGFIGKHYLIAWPVESIPARHLDYEPTREVPEFVLFGSDGGGEALAFDRRAGDWRVVAVTWISMSYSDASLLASSFGEFIGHLQRSDHFFPGS